MSEKKRKILILGGGLSGLSMRYFLSHLAPELEVVLLEKEAELGGVIGQKKRGDFQWALGPKTFQASRTPHLNHLIELLGLAEKKRTSNKAAKKRYLVKEGKLVALPSSLSDFFSARYRPWLGSLIKEWKQPAHIGDETIWAFAKRRFGEEIASDVFDPIALGVFGGDAKQLSIKACFPKLKALEEERGSLSRALLFNKKKKSKARGLFNLEGGMMELVEALKAQGRGEIIQAGVKRIEKKAGVWTVETQDRGYSADHVVCTLPLNQLKLLRGVDKEIERFIKATPCQDIHYVTLIFERDIFTHKGFGCIFPTSEGSDFLGIIFDSCLYQDRGYRCTVMLRKPLAKEVIVAQVRALFNCDDTPVLFDHQPYISALPQFTLGHVKRVHALKMQLASYHPNLTLIGNYLDGVSVEACVQRAYQRALILSQ